MVENGREKRMEEWVRSYGKEGKSWRRKKIKTKRKKRRKERTNEK